MITLFKAVIHMVLQKKVKFPFFGMILAIILCSFGVVFIQSLLF